MKNEDVKVYDGEIMPEKKIQPGNENMMRVRSNYVAAMTVQKPRVMKNVITAVMEEAAAAKDDFYYSWLVNNNKTKKKDLIEGPTIGLAQAIARNWTNCAVETEVKEFGGEWIFKTTFVDFEKGFTTQREFRMLIPQEKSGNYDYERTRDMKFQTGQSKNQRGCICNAIPRWLINQALEAAKEASIRDAGKGTDGKLKKALNSFADKDITEADLLGYFGKKSITEFDANIVAQLRNLWVQLQNKETSVEAIKRQAQDVFDEPKQRNSRTTKKDEKKDKQPDKPKDIKKDPQSDMGKAPTKEAAKVATKLKLTIKQQFDQIIKSFDVRDISQSEITAYYGVDVSEMESESGIEDLKPVIENLEAGTMTPEAFKQEAADRYKVRLTEDSK